MNLLQRWWMYLQTRAEHRTTIKELNKLSDTQLADIGFTRGDIDNLIWLEEDKQQRGGK
jgi:uncharacterized protein YjiS (DUF1127 family)